MKSSKVNEANGMKDSNNNNCKGNAHNRDNRSPVNNAATIKQMLQYSTTADYALIAFGIFGATIAGFGWPALTIIFGDIVDVFAEFQYNITNSGYQPVEKEPVIAEFMKDVYLYSFLTGLTTVGYAIGNFITIYSFQMFSLRQVKIIKRLFFDSILRQEIAWHDQQSSGEFASRLASDFKKFEVGINENLGLWIFNLAAAVINLIMGFIYGWKLSMVIMSMAPVMAVVSYFMAKLQTMFMQKEMTSHSSASSAAEEVISAIRTVFAFSGQNKERERYQTLLKPAMKNGCKRNFVTAIGNASTWGIMYGGFALGIWYGVRLIVSPDDPYTIGTVVIVFWGITGAGFNFGAAMPFFESLQNSRAAAAGIFKVIDRKSKIDSLNTEGKTLKQNFRTDIEFKNIHFGYPSRSDVRILKGLDLKINCGEIVALVGSSGCGKSTLIQLIQRFYDPDNGEILLDGVNIKELNIGWLRGQLGVVGQEPVLFDDSIEQNIRLGMPLEKLDSVINEDIENAAKEANAHEFIKRLPEGYETYVGDRGAQLSGGQKQRIAIARALISKPRILLLDEATSALDLQSEHVVQTALDRASKGRTTIIVAHRLSTIINADRIIYLNGGKVLEMGTHQELMNLKSAYYKLVMAQQTGQDVIKFPNKQPKNSNRPKNDAELPRSASKNLTMQTNPRGGSMSSNNSSMFQGNASNEIGDMDEDQLKQLQKAQFPYTRIFWLIWNDKIYLMIALISSMLYGLSTPIYALIFGGFVDTFATSVDHDVWLDSSAIYSYLFLALAVAMFTSCTLQITLFGFVGEKLTMKLRLMAYSAMLNQEIGWFDQKENSAGALCSRLADDVANIQGATGLRIAMMSQALSAMVISIGVGFYYEWRMAIVSLALMPVIATASICSASIYSKQANEESKSAQKASKLAIEVLNAFRTVASLHKQKYFFTCFMDTLFDHYKTIAGKAFWKAFVIAISLSAPFFAYTIATLYGGFLLSKELLSSGDFFRIVESMIFGAMVVGQTAVLSADFSKAKLAASNIFKLIDRKPIKLYSEESISTDKQIETRSEGNISFRGIHFNYPSRPDTTILNGLSFTASKGETVALVGSSGCGKSTSVQLLERFYDCPKGKILLDGENLNRLNVDWVRSQMALVSQEPILFSYSIKENIAYGDNNRAEVPFDQIVRAAQMANIHDFIQKLPQGYDTPVGGKGSQLSGGQKQRIAIARSLIRNPPILLLDEATSALDTESEHVVQQALDEASKGRTCIVIAHRLQTILNAHKIVVINRGENIEEGTHEELFAKKGHYWNLYNSAH